MSSDMQRDRRTNPYPFTWEIPAAVALVVLVALVIAVHAGAAAANLLAGNGVHWPDRQVWFSSLPGILGGDSTSGLDLTRSAPAVLVWVCVAVSELLTCTALTVGGVALRRYAGPNRIKGMASRSEVSGLLGPARLRKVAPIVRPDLYGRGDTK